MRGHRTVNFSHAMEPEPQGIARTFYQTHLVGGMAGAVAGLALYVWFARAGHPMIASSPLLALIALVGFGTTFGCWRAGCCRCGRITFA